jgi:hypothetical protein
MADRLPIIYVPGCDAPAGGAFAGFDPVLRLMADEEYRLAFADAAPDGAVDPATVWMWRPDAPFDVERAAAALLDFVLLVRRRTGAAKVLLVAYGTGGPVCRSMLAHACPQALRAEPWTTGLRPEQYAPSLVHKLFAYGLPPGGWDPRGITGFPPERVVRAEGYGQLHRFLFGRYRVRADLCDAAVPARDRPLATVFLLDPRRPHGGPPRPRARFALSVRVAGGRGWADTLLVDVGHDRLDASWPLGTWASWRSALGAGPAADPVSAAPLAFTLAGSTTVATVPLPPAGRALLGDGATLRLAVDDWY